MYRASRGARSRDGFRRRENRCALSRSHGRRGRAVATCGQAGAHMNSILESLPVLVLYPHNRCNCRCVMCDIWKIDSAEEISVDELERHLADLRALQVEWVVFSGGEPLMHSDFFRLAGLLRANGLHTTLLSTVF